MTRVVLFEKYTLSNSMRFAEKHSLNQTQFNIRLLYIIKNTLMIFDATDVRYHNSHKLHKDNLKVDREKIEAGFNKMLCGLNSLCIHL